MEKANVEHVKVTDYANDTEFVIVVAEEKEKVEIVAVHDKKHHNDTVVSVEKIPELEN